MPDPEDEDARLRRILSTFRRVAVVGFSKNPEKEAHRVPKYLMHNGYDVVPVNPTAEEILGLRAYATLRNVPPPVEIVDIFRPSEDVPAIVEDAVAVGAKVVWMQSGIRHEEAARVAREAGLDVVQDRCMRTEHLRLVHGM
jgi:predicted CoA-binding protein